MIKRKSPSKKPIVDAKHQKLEAFRDFLPTKLKELGRVAVFIDAANILYSQKTLRWNVDYKKLIALFKKELSLVFIGFYYGRASENKGQEKFFSMLKDRGYTLKTKPIKYIKTPKGFILKGNLDVELAFDILTLKDEFDSCILLSGDSDFEVVLKHLRSVGKKVVVISTKKHIAIELIRNCDKYVNLKKLRKLLERE